LSPITLVAKGNSPQEEAIGHELEKRLRHALTLLPDREAQVFCLRYFEAMQYEEIATRRRWGRGKCNRTHMSCSPLGWSTK
jgi:DNA-directed RNA polymerase specialized sigma24 family protein